VRSTKTRIKKTVQHGQQPRCVLLRLDDVFGNPTNPMPYHSTGAVAVAGHAVALSRAQPTKRVFSAARRHQSSAERVAGV